MEKYKNKEWLIEKYINQKLGCLEISLLCKCSKRTIHQWLIKFKIPRRHSGWYVMPEEQKELRRQWNKLHPEINRMKGKKHSEQTKKLMSEGRRGSNKEKLNAHHILSILEYPEKVFDIENGILLCEKCHKEVHH